jgi:hypothetical protein
MRNTTRRVERVERKASTKALWCVILFLFLGLVGVLVAGRCHYVRCVETLTSLDAAFMT